MTLTNYLVSKKFEELTAKYRFEIVAYTTEHVKFHVLLMNKRKPNRGGLSINFVPRPSNWGGQEMPDMAFTKGSENISSIIFPEPGLPYGYGDIKGTDDALSVILNDDFSICGITTIEIFKRKNIWIELVEVELDHELDFLRKSAFNLIVELKQKAGGFPPAFPFALLSGMSTQIL
ncbi:hypothetical protein [Mangrovibacterium diazotrophicum]|uniref:Uncharacterized protein n=1 Tax=Mangrovibacterium diazotrophicum TaxID=1261403 RepID=A0A419W4P4_9BACT|nr:hypothetical protein [Mangrovibacterium diazotrophicum]RKD90419.1 hypothetical protein BC643_0758 [Mangrovibacterium diazotrophicum]